MPSRLCRGQRQLHGHKRVQQQNDAQLQLERSVPEYPGILQVCLLTCLDASIHTCGVYGWSFEVFVYYYIRKSFMHAYVTMDLLGITVEVARCMYVCLYMSTYTHTQR